MAQLSALKESEKLAACVSEVAAKNTLQPCPVSSFPFETNLNDRRRLPLGKAREHILSDPLSH